MLDPAACGDRAQRLFDSRVMAAGYENVYRRLIVAEPAVEIGLAATASEA